MENTLKRPDLIIWDWDGTLVDSLPLIFMAHNHVREMMSLPLWTREEFQKLTESPPSVSRSCASCHLKGSDTDLAHPERQVQCTKGKAHEGEEGEGAGREGGSWMLGPFRNDLFF